MIPPDWKYCREPLAFFTCILGNNAVNFVIISFGRKLSCFKRIFQHFSYLSVVLF